MKIKVSDKRKRNASPEDVERYELLQQKVNGFKLENGPLRNVTRHYKAPQNVTDIMVIHPHRMSMVKYQYHFNRIEDNLAIFRMNCN